MVFIVYCFVYYNPFMIIVKFSREQGGGGEVPSSVPLSSFSERQCHLTDGFTVIL